MYLLSLITVVIVMLGIPPATANQVHTNTLGGWVDPGNLDKYKPAAPAPVSGTIPAVACKDEKCKKAVSNVKQGEQYNIKGVQKPKLASDKSSAKGEDKAKSSAMNGGSDSKAMDKRTIYSNTEGLLEGQSLTKIKTNADYLAVGAKLSVLSGNGGRLNGETLANAPGTQVQVVAPGGVAAGTVLPRAQMLALMGTSTTYTDRSISLAAVRGGSTAKVVAVELTPPRPVGDFMQPRGDIKYYGATDKATYDELHSKGRATRIKNMLFEVLADGRLSPLGGGGGGDDAKGQ